MARVGHRAQMETQGSGLRETSPSVPWPAVFRPTPLGVRRRYPLGDMRPVVREARLQAGHSGPR